MGVIHDRWAAYKRSQSGTSGTSASKIAEVTVGGLTVTAGAESMVDFTGGSITKGDDHWGVPGSALDLDLTIDGSGRPELPDADKVYDLIVSVSLACDAADAGQMVGVRYSGNDVTVRSWVPVLASGSATFAFATADRTFVGDSASHVRVLVNASNLTVDATLSTASILVVER